MWTSIQRILTKKINVLGLQAAFEFARLKTQWDDLTVAALGVVFQKKSQPLMLKNQVLTVDCLNSVWANELQMKEPLILGELGKKFRKMQISRIRFIN